MNRVTSSDLELEPQVSEEIAGGREVREAKLSRLRVGRSHVFVGTTLVAPAPTPGAGITGADEVDIEC